MEAGAAGRQDVRVAAVYGAATPPGRLALALQRAVESLERDVAVSVSRVDLHARPLPMAGTHAPANLDEATHEALAAVQAADAALFASPVYRGSFPGVLKNLLDLLPVEALRGKAVASLVVGATAHHSLGVDRHLRDVLAWFGALVLPVGVYLTSEDFGADGLREGAAAELGALATGLVALARATRDVPTGPPPLALRQG